MKCRDFRPDHNGDCLNCDEWIGEHMNRVIIAGGREFDDYPTLAGVCLKAPFVIDEVVSGCARGADKLGERFANVGNLPLARFPADWTRYGKSAGYKRNEQMAEYATHLIAFWDGQSKGTKHMIDIATREGLVVLVHRY